MTMKRGMKWSRIGRFVSCHLPGVWSGEDGEVPLSSAVSRTRGEKESIGARVGTPRRGGNHGGGGVDRSKSSSGDPLARPTYNIKLTGRRVVYTLSRGRGCCYRQVAAFSK